MARVLNDLEVAQFLQEFFARDIESQQASPIWQELESWQARGDDKPKTLMSEAKKKEPSPPSLVSKDLERSAPPVPEPPKVAGCTPWKGTNIPVSGMCFVGLLDGDNPPPGKGWKRVEAGWARTE